MKIATLAGMCFTALLAVTSAFGQMGPQRVNIGFQFMVGKKLLPAGEYVVVHDKESTPFVTVRSADGKSAIQIRVITLLAREKSSDNSARLVFDKVGEQEFLSEVWVPGQEGLLVHATKGSHGHQVVPGSHEVVTASR